MNTESGVSMEGVQHSICTGNEYGGRAWSNTERQEACQRYEELTGTKLNPTINDAQTGNYLFLWVILACVVISGIFACLYWHKSTKNQRKK